MQTYFGILTIGATPVQIPTSIFPAQNGSPLVCKLSVQSAPGNTGNTKIGGNAAMTADATTPGTFLASTAQTNPDASAQAGGFWSIESYNGRNTIPVSQYFFHGSHSGDKLMYEIHVEV